VNLLLSDADLSGADLSGVGPSGAGPSGAGRGLALSARVREQEEAASPRWTWDDTNRWYPALLDAGVRVVRSHDLRLSHTILRRSPLAAGTPFAQAPPGPWDALEPVPAGPPPPVPGAGPRPEVLFELDDAALPARESRPALNPGAELAAQEQAVATSTDPGRLRFLLAAESAGALVAAELHHTGLPWRADLHDRILTEALGPRSPLGQRPARLEALAVRIREAIDAPPSLNPDSHPALLKALQYAGVGTRSLSRWELEEIQHPVVEPLLEYKKLSRLLTATGWNWLDTWVRDGRFRSEYVVGGVVTGRWSSVGGGALQLPKAVRRAVVADPGWVLVVADVAQLEPRALAAMSGDEAMAAAGRGEDMYAGIVASGAVATRDEAKVGMLSAMYGGTTGVGAAVLPSLARTFPRAFTLVEDAARAGERGEVVSTWLGRGSPRPGEAWEAVQAGAYDADDGARARSMTRSWGRFTRNFVVQGTAAEWALVWLAAARRRLWELGEARTSLASTDSRSLFARRPHLAFFLHDEVVVHSPRELAGDVERELRAAAAEAGRLLFGDAPVDFPLSVATVESYADAK